MVSLAITSVLVGMLLGQRFRVLVLLPATALAVLVVLGNGLAAFDSASGLMLRTVGTMVSLQIGYLLGLVVHHLLTGRAARLRPLMFANSSMKRHPAP